MANEALEWTRDQLLTELEMLAWIGPADAATIGEQYGDYDRERLQRRMACAAAYSLVVSDPTGRWTMTDEGWTMLRDATDGEPDPA